MYDLSYYLTLMPKLPQHIGVVWVGLEGIPLIQVLTLLVVFILEVSLVPEILQDKEYLDPASVNPEGM